MSIEQIILTFSYFGILALMVSNGFFSFPSSQILYLVAGYFAFTGDLNLFVVILIGALGHSLGNLIMYEVSRKHGIKYSVKFVKFFFHFGNPEKEIKKFQLAFEKRSKFLLFVGKLVNPIKIFISIPAGIIKMNRFIFLIIVYITSAIWASIFTLIGFYWGKSYENFGFIGLGVLVIAIIVMTYFYKLMNSDEILKKLDLDEGKSKSGIVENSN